LELLYRLLCLRLSLHAPYANAPTFCEADCANASLDAKEKTRVILNAVKGLSNLRVSCFGFNPVSASVLEMLILSPAFLSQ